MLNFPPTHHNAPCRLVVCLGRTVAFSRLCVSLCQVSLNICVCKMGNLRVKNVVRLRKAVCAQTGANSHVVQSAELSRQYERREVISCGPGHIYSKITFSVYAMNGLTCEAPPPHTHEQRDIHLDVVSSSDMLTCHRPRRAVSWDTHRDCGWREGFEGGECTTHPISSSMTTCKQHHARRSTRQGRAGAWVCARVRRVASSDARAVPG